MAPRKESPASRVKLNITLPAVSADELRCVLAYEACMRNRSMGQAAFELVMQAASIESYPDELKARLAEVEREIERAAVERSLSRVGE